MNHSHCILCNSKDISELEGYERHQLSKCQSCGFVFMSRIPSIDELHDHYKLYSYASDRTVSPLTIDSYNKLLDGMEKYRKLNTLIDVGCGKGWFLIEARKRGWKVYGTEFSDEAIRICTAAGIEMTKGDLRADAFEGLQFDVVFSSEVIEHVNNPRTQFQQMFAILRPGGLLYLTTPNFNCYLRFKFKADYNIIEYPEHLGYFTKSTLNFALKATGFVKRKLLTTGISLDRASYSKNAGTSAAVVPVKLIPRDESIRATMSKNRMMLLIKSMANFFLSVTGIGITLKASYQKPL
jgi:2-polyprenyl-3-methyl-5-hydroxy-6-metoxy-1,4-benzoquinol methylase